MINNMKLEKTEVEGLVKDIDSGAVLNVDYSALEAYKKRKRTNEEFIQFKEKIQKIDNDILEIKNVLKIIAEKI